MYVTVSIILWCNVWGHKAIFVGVSPPRRLTYVQYMGVLGVKLQCNAGAVIYELIIIIIIIIILLSCEKIAL